MKGCRVTEGVLREAAGRSYRIRSVLGQLRFVATGDVFQLGPRCILGRGSKCDVRVEDPRVSSEHAVVTHNGQTWELKDLGSKNGTMVGRRHLAPADRATLLLGSRFTLGGRAVFEVVDIEPPGPVARGVRTGVVRVAAKGMLALPDDNEPAVTVFASFEGTWVAESSNGQREVANGDVIAAGSEEWRLELPVTITATLDSMQVGPTVDTVLLRFVVSRDEHVKVSVVYDGREKDLAPRSFHYLLLTLARAWLEDASAPPGDRGWVDREDLCRMLNIDAGNLNVDVYRARRQIGAAGIHGAPGLVVRRADSGQLRLGVQQVEVVSTTANGPSSGNAAPSSGEGAPASEGAPLGGNAAPASGAGAPASEGASLSGNAAPASGAGAPASEGAPEPVERSGSGDGSAP